MHSALLAIFAALSVVAGTVSAADRKHDDRYENDWDYGYDDAPADYEYGYGKPEYPEHKPEYPSHKPDYPEHNPEYPTYKPDQPTYKPDQPTYKPDQPTYKPDQPTYKPEYPTSSAPHTSVIYPVATSYAPSTKTEIYPVAVTATANQTRTRTATNLAYSTCYETAYAYICDTGMCKKTYTVTEHCPTACPTYRPSTYIPQHFTTTVSVCNHCGPQPTTVIITYMPTNAPYTSMRRENTTTSTRIHTDTSTYTSRPASSAGCGYDCPPTYIPTLASSATAYKPPMNTSKSAMPTYTGAANTVGVGSAVVAGVLAAAAMLI
ncbi:hypothetical protein B9Z19DRAFT_702632 [Tuber borchii]|uniref:Uncharacterized protein n=1 Tax=Tuber borchii TaxID=42251 RepID=A0A2T6ZYZ0_TUBBO|nr:hypothetical protein B9Z19DRAFT_702632 [Tuber borchii]